MKLLLLITLISFSCICTAETFTVTEQERKEFFENKGFSFYRENGENAGYKITSFLNQEYYEKVGIKKGYVVTHIDDHDLRTADGARGAIKVLEASKEFEFTYHDGEGGKAKKAVFKFEFVK